MQYFKHMSNMRNDKRIKKLIIKFGIEGYGWYNLILESITESLTTQKPLPELEETCEELALFYNGNTTTINEIVCWMINEGLFEINEINSRVTCHKIYKYLEASQTRSNEIRNMITQYKQENQKQLKLLSENVTDSLETVQDKSEEQNRTEQNRTEQNRIEKKKKEKNIIHNDIIEEIYQSYPTRDWKQGYSTGRCQKNRGQIKKLLKKYTKEQIMNEIENHVAERQKAKLSIKTFSRFLEEFPDPEQEYDIANMPAEEVMKLIKEGKIT